jgi:hypothetical protein
LRDENIDLKVAVYFQKAFSVVDIRDTRGQGADDEAGIRPLT